VARAGKSLRMTTDAAGRALALGREQLPAVAEGRIAEVFDKLRRLLPPAAPKTRFSGKITSNRVVEGFGMPFSRIRRIRARVPGSTLNDVFLAVAGGAARRYLLEHGGLPEQSLSALMPISLRSDASAGGNQVAGMPVKVRSDIADPLERLKAVHDEARKGKEQAEAMGLDLLMNVVEVLPPFVANAMFFRAIVSRVNLAVSNVRGPEEALYLAGAKAMCMYPVSIPTEGCGLNFTGVSYNGVMWVSMVSCRSMVPDPGAMLACMRGAWEELLAAADALPDPSSPVERRTSRRRKAGQATAKRASAAS
jgi:WS/DGAT/MGAT family acyltransferase